MNDLLKVWVKLDPLDSERQRVKQDGKIHEESTIANVVKVVLWILMNQKGPVGT